MALRPPVKWHGGKRYLAKRIVDCFRTIASIWSRSEGRRQCC